jgi:hypothetical protein
MSKNTLHKTKQWFCIPLLFLCLGILFLSSSCSITKRHYRSGYFIERSHHKKIALKSHTETYSHTQATKPTKYLKKEVDYKLQDQAQPQGVRNVSSLKREKAIHKGKLTPKIPLHLSTVAAQNHTTNSLSASPSIKFKEKNTFNFGIASLIFLLLFWLLVLAVPLLEIASYVLFFLLLLLFFILIVLGPAYALAGLFYKKPASCRIFSAIAVLLWILSITLLILLF